MTNDNPFAGSDPARLFTMRRRALLRGAPIAALTLAAGGAMAFQAPTPATPPVPVDPIPGWFDEWRRVTADWNSEAEKPEAGNFDTPECLRLNCRRNELDKMISGTVATSVQGVRAQLEWMSEDGFLDGGCDLYADLIDNAVKALSDLASIGAKRTSGAFAGV